MKGLFLFLGIIFLLISCGTVDTNQSEMNKEIKVVVEEVPNYIFHLMTLGKIVPEDSEYISLYQNSISAKDQQYLHEQRELLAWANGNTGLLTVPFFFIPAYINFQSQKDFHEYFDVLNYALQHNDFQLFVSKYYSDLKKMELMFGSINWDAYLQSCVPYLQTVYEISEIYKRNFQTYHEEVWPKEKMKMQQVANSLNAKLKNQNLITRWETLIGTEFKTDDYQIILFSSNKHGPNANSLGYERNTFYYGNDIDFIIQFISHEVGTHLLIETFHDVINLANTQSKTQFEFSQVYGAYENLAEFYSIELILGGEPLIGMNFDVKTYYQIFKNIYEQDKNISPKDLMIKGLEIYTAQNE
jgi:hypothetical protein